MWLVTIEKDGERHSRRLQAASGAEAIVMMFNLILGPKASGPRTAGWSVVKCVPVD